MESASSKRRKSSTRRREGGKGVCSVYAREADEQRSGLLSQTICLIIFHNSPLPGWEEADARKMMRGDNATTERGSPPLIENLFAEMPHESFN
jgi:hypothetical protein